MASDHIFSSGSHPGWVTAPGLFDNTVPMVRSRKKRHKKKGKKKDRKKDKKSKKGQVAG